jgi:cytochrome bd-type quinol oxidase subunit 1
VYGLLRTGDALSKAVDGGQVLISIVLFTVIYLFLILVWLTVLNRKIKTGPEDEMSEIKDAPKRSSWIDTAATLADPRGTSMTDAHLDTKNGKGR